MGNKKRRYKPGQSTAAMAVVLVTFQQGHNSDFNSLFSEKRRTINQLATATKTAEALAMATTH